MLNRFFLAGAVLLLASTAALADTATIVGGALGGAAGAAVGESVGGRNGAVIGGAVGGGVGAAIGNDYAAQDGKPAHSKPLRRHHDNGLHKGWKKHKHQDKDHD